MTGVLHAAQPLELAGSRPNILFILTDDQGKRSSAWAMTGLYTPPGRPMGKSTRLDDFHSQPHLFPTRGALMSGRLLR